jgi:hypothetical protein
MLSLVSEIDSGSDGGESTKIRVDEEMKTIKLVRPL